MPGKARAAALLAATALAAVGYGLANWLMVEGETERGRAMLEELATNDGSSAFGVIAAEADLAALSE